MERRKEGRKEKEKVNKGRVRARVRTRECMIKRLGERMRGE